MRSVQRTLSLRGIARCSIPYEVLYVIARHRFAVLWQSPGRESKTHARYFCTCVEKKAHTSKRVSIIAPDNAISKAQCAPCGCDIAFAVILSSTVICLRRDICPSGKLRIYLNFG